MHVKMKTSCWALVQEIKVVYMGANLDEHIA